MNYIDELNSFYDWVTFNQISLDVQGLWNLLMQMNNKLAVKINNIWYWPVEFSIPNSKILLMSGCSQQQLIRSRNALIKAGRITYEKGKGNQSGTYTIIPFDSSLKDCYIDNSSVKVWAAAKQNDKQSVNNLINKTEPICNQNENKTETNYNQNGNKQEINYNQSENETETNPSFYLLDIKDKTKNKINNKTNNTAVVSSGSYDDAIQEYTSDDELKKAVYDFIEMRKKIKKPLTENGLKLVFKKLDKLSYSTEEKVEVLNQSTMNSWQGVFELKDKGGGKNGNRNENNVGADGGGTCKTGDNTPQYGTVF